MASLKLNQLNCTLHNITFGQFNNVIKDISSTPKIKIKDMKFKKYIFSIKYTENKEDKFGTLSLWASNLIHANDMFKRLYCPDRCGSAPEPDLEVYSVTESTSLV